MSIVNIASFGYKIFLVFSTQSIYNMYNKHRLNITVKTRQQITSSHAQQSHYVTRRTRPQLYTKYGTYMAIWSLQLLGLTFHFSCFFPEQVVEIL